MNRFDNAVNALVDAYVNDTLYRNDCASCAVGNIVNAAHGMKTPKAYIKQLNFINRSGQRAEGFSVNIDHLSKPQHARVRKSLPWLTMIKANIEDDAFMPGCYIPEKDVNKQIFKATGYSFDEMQEIEVAFMNNTRGGLLSSKEEIDQMHFEGLMAVVDLLISWEDTEIDRSEIEARFLAKV